MRVRLRPRPFNIQDWSLEATFERHGERLFGIKKEGETEEEVQNRDMQRRILACNADDIAGGGGDWHDREVEDSFDDDGGYAGWEEEGRYTTMLFRTARKMTEGLFRVDRRVGGEEGDEPEHDNPVRYLNEFGRVDPSQAVLVEVDCTPPQPPEVRAVHYRNLSVQPRDCGREPFSTGGQDWGEMLENERRTLEKATGMRRGGAFLLRRELSNTWGALPEDVFRTIVHRL